jgi:hypothetical protein
MIISCPTQIATPGLYRQMLYNNKQFLMQHQGAELQQDDIRSIRSGVSIRSNVSHHHHANYSINSRNSVATKFDKLSLSDKKKRSLNSNNESHEKEMVQDLLEHQPGNKVEDGNVVNNSEKEEAHKNNYENKLPSKEFASEKIDDVESIVTYSYGYIYCFVCGLFF